MARYADARRILDRLARIMALAGRERIAERMDLCGRVIAVGRCEQCGKVHSVRVDRMCGHRLCPLCSMRRSRVQAAQGLAAMEWMRENVQGPYSLQLISLTQQNVRRGELAREVDALQAALKDLRNSRAVRRGLIGAARAIEITCNPRQEKGMIWHPHIHFIAMVGEQAPELATEQWWRDSWYALMGLSARQRKEHTQIDVRPIQDAGAIFEISKYVAKVADLWGGLTDEEAAPLLAELDGAISGRRLHEWQGAWRNARRALRQADVERMASEELDEVAAACPDCGGELLDGLMRWAGMKYEPHWIWPNTKEALIV